MDADTIKKIKADLRKDIRSRLAELSNSTRGKIDADICKQVLEFDEYLKADTVFLYYGIDWEINTEPLIQAAMSDGKKVVLPKCIDKIHMEARYINSLNDLIPGVYNIPEPSDESQTCPTEDIDFAIIPCIACDSDCRRLGQGGGYYDRFLRNSTFYKAALCKSEGLVSEIPVDDFDEFVDCVITENEIIFRAAID